MESEKKLENYSWDQETVKELLMEIKKEQENDSWRLRKNKRMAHGEWERKKIVTHGEWEKKLYLLREIEN